ncbi:MAG: toprim domain-containing protein [Alphaproteobacteria bacterium]
MTKPRSDAHARIPAADIAARLADRAQDLCRRLLPGGRREGAEWRCGSVQGEPGKSLGIHLNGAKAGIWSDFATGEGGDLLDLIEAVLNLDTAGAIGWAKNWFGIDDGPTPRPRSAPKSERHDEDTAKRTEAAVAIWSASRPAPGTPVESYLQYRSITIRVPPTLRYNPGVKYAQSGLYMPCMVAAIQAPDRRISGIHRTYIRDDGMGKAGVATPKMALGPIGRGAVRLGPAGSVLGIAEGIETALSAMQLFGVPVWCALGSRFDRIALPEEVQRVIIFADSGEAGMDAANRALGAFNEQGRQTEICVPDLGDFNDVLGKESAA